jgi:hypothetical protein
LLLERGTSLRALNPSPNASGEHTCTYEAFFVALVLNFIITYTNP